MQNPVVNALTLAPVPPVSRRAYRPKDYSVLPRDFGRDRGLRWLAPPEQEGRLVHDARVLAARLQHGLVYLLRNKTAAAGTPTDAEHADRTGIDRDRFGRIRRGDLPIRTEEVGLICTAYDIPSWRVVNAAGLGEPRQPAPKPTQAMPTAPTGRSPTRRIT